MMEGGTPVGRAVALGFVILASAGLAQSRPDTVATQPISDHVVPALIEGLASNDANARQNAAWTLYRLGNRAKAAVPALIQALSDERVATRVNSAMALGAIGFEARLAFDDLLSVARHQPSPVRENAIWALSKIC